MLVFFTCKMLDADANALKCLSLFTCNTLHANANANAITCFLCKRFDADANAKVKAMT